jgi:enediyne biosynthesis protein E4
VSRHNRKGRAGHRDKHAPAAPSLRAAAFVSAVPVALVVAGLTGGCDRANGSSISVIGDPSSVAAAAGNAVLSTRFADVGQTAGLDYEWKIAGKRPLNILQTIGNGCAFLDYDNDGNLDILLIGDRLALYKGNGKGKFTDVSAATGIDKLKGHFLGCAVGDADNDGWRDIYVSGYRTGVLLRNAQGKSFKDISASAGIQPQPWGTSAAFAETIPGSGKLDLYVCNYAVFGPDTQPQLCNENGRMTSCGPRHYEPLKGALYRNDGGLRFTDITKSVGGKTVAGKALGVAFADFEGNGIPGIALANDEMPGDLLKPSLKLVGGKTSVAYENIGELSGTAFDRDGNMHGGMGTDWGDYDNDGKPDLFVATFQNEVKSLYRNEGEGRFMDVGIPSGISLPATPFVAFGVKFLDFDNDGNLDLVVANGHVQDNIAEVQTGAVYRQSSQLFRNKGGKPILFEDVSSAVGPDFGKKIIGRGLATGDYDNDGKVDVLIVDSEGKPLLLHNEGGPAHHWLGVQLVGTKSNRDGYGATVTLKTAGGKMLYRHCHADGSYMSSSDPRVHFGLGTEEKVESLTVRWPSGRTETFDAPTVDRYMVIEEGKGRE